MQHPTVKIFFDFLTLRLAANCKLLAIHGTRALHCKLPYLKRRSMLVLLSENLPLVIAFLNILYWFSMENVYRHKDAKTVGTKDNATVSQEFGKSKSTFVIVYATVCMYALPLICRLCEISPVPMHLIATSNQRQFASGTAVMVSILAILLRRWAMVTLGRFFSRRLGVQGTSHQVINTGPYAYVRHPGYAANVILYFIYTIVMSGDLGVAVVAYGIYWTALTKVRIPEEEKMLSQDKHLKRPYQTYMKNIKYRVIPFIY